MGERKAVNKYYPPDFDPSKGSLNSWLGTHPLRDRARKLHKGILIIRFEMPYNIWCSGCNNHIGMGVRYNAEKSKVGNYYSTPIYKFRMKCHLCNNHFEIQTDPKNHDYVILEGARRKEQRWDPHENEQIVPEDKVTQKKLATDPMFKLEHSSNDQQGGKATHLSVAQIEDLRNSWSDDYMLNKMARTKFREEKNKIAISKKADKALLDKSSLEIELVSETEEDKKIAGLLKYTVTKSLDEKQKERRRVIESSPLFTRFTASQCMKKGKSSKQIRFALSLHRPRVNCFASNLSPSQPAIVELGPHVTAPKSCTGMDVEQLEHGGYQADFSTDCNLALEDRLHDRITTVNKHSVNNGDVEDNEKGLNISRAVIHNDNTNNCVVDKTTGTPAVVSQPSIINTDRTEMKTFGLNCLIDSYCESDASASDPSENS